MEHNELTEQDILDVTGSGSDKQNVAIGVAGGTAIGGAAASAYGLHKTGALQNQIEQHGNQIGELQTQMSGVKGDIQTLKSDSLAIIKKLRA